MILTAAPAASRTRIPIADILTGLSHALDITEGHPRGHAARSCLIGMRLARAIGLPDEHTADLFYALLLKDAGCSSNAARVHQLFGGNDLTTKRAVWMRDWRNLHQQLAYAFSVVGRGETLRRKVTRFAGLAAAGPAASRELFQIRCDRGAAIAIELGLSAATASAIRSMDEHWDGGGHPEGLAGDRIPLLARIIGLAQVVEIFSHDGGPALAYRVARKRSGRWFDPALVDAMSTFERDDTFWSALMSGDQDRLVAAAEPVHGSVVATEARLDGIATAFASVIDAKSPYTSDHSQRVARFAASIAERLGASKEAIVRVRRAGLLHDIGKLGVPNSILDKPGPLTADEWRIVARHPQHTFEVLDRVPVFRAFAFDASAHHETLNASGYHMGLSGDQISRDARILAVADRVDALLADRPYRTGLPVEEVRRILDGDCAKGLICPAATDAVKEILDQRPAMTPPLACCG